MTSISQTAALTDDLEAMDSVRRFGGVARLYGATGLARLQAAHICIIGIGGVGSWAAEALARNAVGTITLIDLDNICLLYTSPSPRDRTRSRMPSSA